MYFKITNEEEKHHGLQYQDGIVEDFLPFNDNPEDSCCSGGIYFSDQENIYKYFDYGPWIRQVDIPEDGKYLKDPDEDKWRANKVFLHPRKLLWTVETFEWLIENGLSVDNFSKCILVNRSIDYLEIVKLFIEKHNADVNMDNSSLLISAIVDNNLTVAAYLIEKGIHMEAQNCYALRLSVYHNNLKAIKFLIDAGIKYNFKILKELYIDHYTEELECILNQKTSLRNELIKLQFKAFVYLQNTIKKFNLK